MQKRLKGVTTMASGNGFRVCVCVCVCICVHACTPAAFRSDGLICSEVLWWLSCTMAAWDTHWPCCPLLGQQHHLQEASSQGGSLGRCEGWYPSMVQGHSPVRWRSPEWLWGEHTAFWGVEIGRILISLKYQHQKTSLIRSEQDAVDKGEQLACDLSTRLYLAWRSSRDWSAWCRWGEAVQVKCLARGRHPAHACC